MGSLYNLMKPYSEFRSKEEFNTYQKKVLKCYRVQLNKTDSIIIHFLGKYAVNEKQKTVGVACPLMETIATNVGKSICMVRRSIAKLEELGIIKRVATKERHKRGGYSARFIFRDWIGVEWGAALRRRKGIPLFDPFKKEPCI
ncbi:hypothetical protein COD67_19255 [Bacillus cereus]|nr:hypothetical protein COI89_21225 [Bacillus cereus]PGU64160.1 hypothetical protein COD67_19255 [Bacillus cereus]